MPNCLPRQPDRHARLLGRHNHVLPADRFFGRDAFRTRLLDRETIHQTSVVAKARTVPSRQWDLSQPKGKSFLAEHGKGTSGVECPSSLINEAMRDDSRPTAPRRLGRGLRRREWPPGSPSSLTEY